MTAPPPARTRQPGAPRAHWAVWAVAAAVCAIDQGTKALVLALDPSSADRRGGGLLSVHLLRNTGAGFGIGAGHPVVITIVAAAATVVVLVLLWSAGSRAAALCWAVVLGGALGNLADRMLRSPGPGLGAVVDWIRVDGYPATFNLADVAIRAGSVAAVVAMIVSGRRAQRRGTAPGTAATTAELNTPQVPAD
ncbi:MAG TPA: signal peptidase II [Actinocrinis sp.]